MEEEKEATDLLLPTRRTVMPSKVSLTSDVPGNNDTTMEIDDLPLVNTKPYHLQHHHSFDDDSR